MEELMALKKKQAVNVQRGHKTVSVQSVNSSSPVTQNNQAAAPFISSEQRHNLSS